MSASVRDVMTTRVVALRQDTDYKEIVAALRRHRVSACPVIDDSNRPLGVVSEADLLYKEADPDYPAGPIRLEWRLTEDCKANAVTADQLMTAPAVTIEPEAPVAAAARLMQDKQVRRLPVVGRDGQLVGIVTRSDVLSVFERPDADIWDEIGKGILDEEFGLDPDSFEFTVRSGIVTIGGLVELRQTALNLLARIRHTEGVVSARDRLSYPTQDESVGGRRNLPH
jgi:CBS domain-containing protein